MRRYRHAAIKQPTKGGPWPGGCCGAFQGLGEPQQGDRSGVVRYPVNANLRRLVALATPAFAQARSTTLSDATEPGSVIVFPKFINAAPVTLPESTRAVTVLAPVTELEIGVVCPKGVTCPETRR